MIFFNTNKLIRISPNFNKKKFLSALKNKPEISFKKY